MKNKKVLKILAASTLSMMMLVGFAESKTELMGDSYVRFGQMEVETAIDKMVNIVGDQIYFIADGSNENITEYCSMDDYYIKQLEVDGYLHSIAIGGDISGNIHQGGISELGFANRIEFLGEVDNYVADGNLVASGIYRYASTPGEEEVMPNWFVKLADEYEIGSGIVEEFSKLSL